MNYVELFRASCLLHGDRIAVSDSEHGLLTYAELDAQSDRAAGKIRALGARRGQFVLLQTARNVTFPVLYLGILKAGCVAVPLDGDCPPERADFIRTQTASPLTVTDDFASDLGSFAPLCEPADGKGPALLLYTSGSTGTPKGILHSAGDLARAAMRERAFFDGIDRIENAAVCPFSFVAHTEELLAVFLLGGHTHIVPDDVRRDVRKLEDYIAGNGITTAVITSRLLRLYQNKAKSLRRVLTGSERLSGVYTDGFEIRNAYGMSEIAHCTYFPVLRKYDNTPIGRALPDLALRIVDERGAEVPDGTEGEIAVEGVFDVCYFKDPARTRATMIPLDGGKTRVMTGDIGVKNENGEAVFLHRRDTTVKINGQRVDTGEAELLLSCMPEIDAAVVKAFVGRDGETYLAAFYTCRDKIAEDEIRERLRGKIPEYAIPRRFVLLPEMPVTRTGKPDRAALTEPGIVTDAQREEPANDAERALCRAFAEVLGEAAVGATDDFALLGGDSLQAMRVVALSGIDALSPDDVLAAKTPRKIAALLSEKTKAAGTLHADVPAFCPLSPSQLGVYLEAVQKPDSLMYNIPVRVLLPAGTDEARFLDAVKTVLRHHPVLNVTVDEQNGMPGMLSHDVPPVVTVKDVRDLDEEIRAFVRPYDLTHGPLYRAEYCRTPSGDAFLWDAHHIVFDGTSLSALLHGIVTVYAGGECGDEQLSQFDVSLAEQQPKDDEKREEAKRFYRDLLEGNDLDLAPLSDVVTEETNAGCATLQRSAPGITQDEVRRYTTAQNVTENALFLAAFAFALAKFNGSKESFFTTAHHGRRDPKLLDTFGMFVRTMPIYATFGDNDRVHDFIAGIGDLYYAVKHHDEISFSELAEEYGAGTKISFIFQNQLLSDVQMPTGKAGVTLLNREDLQLDLDVMVLKTDDGYSLMAHYRRSVYSEALVREFSALYLQTVKEMLQKETLADIDLMDSESQAKLCAINATEAPYDGTVTPVDLFRRQAKATPDNVCLVFTDRRYTYREVDRITDNLAAHLCRLGIGKGKIAGVLIPRCEHMLLCSLGILKAGAAYLPLDPSYPEERLNLMMEDSGASMLIADPSLFSLIHDSFRGVRMPVSDVLTLPDCDGDLPRPAPGDLFVMLYTSGSTGKPKGVMFAHSNALVTAEWVKSYFAMDEHARVVSYASYGFDAHVFDLYPAVTSGAELHIIAEDIRLDFPALRDYFNQNGITHAVMTTQVGRQFAEMRGLSTLRHLSVAGEKLTPPELPEGFSLYNLYGPTEGSVVTSGFRIDRRYRDVPIGKFVDNLKGYIVDKNGKLLPPGAVGELWISGPHVTQGYRNRPEKTAEAYGDNPFPHPDGYGRVYRTGDIVRFLPDGNLQFVGRRDAQVKVRGFRVELTEIEEVVRRFPGVKDATVAAFDDPAGGKFVAAYVVSDEKIDPSALGDFIRAEKPPYMVPAVTMQIDKIPLNQNQKVNKKALPVPVRETGEIVPPRNENERRVLEIAADVLRHRDFGVTTDLYEAGLTSIGAVKLNVKLAEAFGAALRTSDIKANPTVATLASFLAAASPAAVFEKKEDYPITATQNGIFVECMANPGTTVYNIPVLMKISDELDPERLRCAVRSAIDAHPYVKTLLFTDDGGNVRARRRDDAPANVDLLHCEILPSSAMLVRPFSLLGEPLYRAAVYVTKDGNYLFLDFHHILCDGTSETVLFRDISRAYAGDTLTAEVYSGFEAAEEEAANADSERKEAARDYWKDLLSGCDCALPKKEPEDDPKGAGSRRRTGKTAPAAIRAFCEGNGLTGNAFFNGVYAFVMSRFIGKETMTYATVYNGRSDSRLADAVTMLVQTLPVTATTDGDTKVLDYLCAMQKQLLDSMTNDAVPFAELSHDYGVTADLMLVYQGDNFQMDTLCGKPSQMLEFPPETAKAPISVTVNLAEDGFVYGAEYRRDHFSAAFADALLDAMDVAAGAFLTAEKLHDVSMLSDAAQATYDRLNGDAPCAPGDLFVHQYVEKTAAETPDLPAVRDRDGGMTYRELDACANRITNALKMRGITPGTVVGLILDRTRFVPAVELAVMKAGGAFLPMIPSYPDERIDYCLQNAESPVAVVSARYAKEHAALFAGKPFRPLILDELLAETDDARPDVSVGRDDLAYCIYTSGSTGTPKGVMISHGNFASFAATAGLPLSYLQNKRLTGSTLAVSSFSFDMSIYDLYMPLCNGKCVYIPTEEELHNPLQLVAAMQGANVQMMTCTPSFLNNLIGMEECLPAIAALRTVVVGAEAFPGPLFDALRKISPELQIVNGYGPTETTICCSTKELHSASNVTIGRPNANTKFFVCDKYGNVLPPYAIGELIICGDGVGRGYQKLPEKTAASFFSLRGLPAYHSGDSVRLCGRAEIDFGGRMDNQVKLRGFRVELDEIEKVMCSYPTVRQCKVLVRNNGTEDYLAGFFTATTAVDTDALTAHLKSRLTYYMVPAVLCQLDAMPLTPNGKIDKKGFPEVTKTAARKTGKRAAKKSLEQRLCEIYADVLKQEEIYADDDFFELGGTSLSASKVTMLLMSEGIEVKYGDIFDHPTPESLAGFIEERDAKAAPAAPDAKQEDAERFRAALRYNTVEFAHEVKRERLGDVLLTGATGFLGVHVLKELLDLEDGHITCLIHRGSHESALVRLKTMLIYYFSNGFEDELRDRISIVEADITDAGLDDALRDVSFDTVINCAACVKHFTDDDILTRVNVHGVENLIALCQRRNARLVQVSTVSVPGVHTKESYKTQIRMHENETFIVDSMDNKYVLSKREAELRIMDAIEEGTLRAKIVRVGNLMGRHSDGEFQANMETNMFLSGIRGFAIMGKYPISHMTDPMSFSPVDCTARAVVLLAGTNDKFTAFHADNRYGFDEMKLIDACNCNGIPILPTADEQYYAEFREKLGDPKINAALGGLAAYDIKDGHAVETDNLFTTNVLYRIGFSWPLVDETYLERAINSIMTLDYFNMADENETR